MLETKPKIMKKIIFLITISFLFSNLSFSQAGGNEIYEQNNRYEQNKNYNEDSEMVWDLRKDNILKKDILYSGRNNEMIFTVNSLMNVKADAYLAIFSIIQAGKTAKEVNLLVNEKINKFKNELKAKNINLESVFTDMISLVPVYEYEVEKKLFSKTYIEVPKGFEMQKNLHVQFTDEALLDDIMTSAADNEIYDLIKVEYFVNDNEKRYTELREKSIAYMQKKLESFKKLDVKLDTVYHILSEKTSVVYPVDRYRSYQAFTGTSIEAVKSKYVTKVRKPRTVFYNKLPYHKYDIVINPSIIEPAVQFTYSISLKYIIKEPIKKHIKEFILVTPNGTVRPLKVE